VNRCSMLFALALLSAVTFTALARAQDSPDPLGSHTASIFAEFSAADVGQGDGALLGGTGGANLQRGLLGLVLRGTVAPGNQNVHIYQAVLGPRFALDLPVLQPFVEAGGGMGRAVNNNTFSGPGWGAAWQVAAGVEHDLGPHLTWRIAEAAYGHIYAAGGISPAIVSTGLRLNLW